METSLLICSTNQWNGFYMTRTSAMIELHFPYMAKFGTQKFDFKRSTYIA